MCTLQSTMRGRQHTPEPPGEDLRASTVTIAGEPVLVLSYTAAPSKRIATLTATETAVLRAALGGLSNAEIAALRGRALSTIENQLATAFRKLGVTTRAEAATLLGEAW